MLILETNKKTVHINSIGSNRRLKFYAIENNYINVFMPILAFIDVKIGMKKHKMILKEILTFELTRR